MGIEGKERTFVPYKGWRVENMGQLVPDPLMHIANEPPLKIVDDIDRFVNSNEISHKHILYNVLDKCGKEILSKWVRKISYVTSLDIYFIEDNNEDELLEKNNYKFFNSNEYCERHNVITNAGELLSKDWFDDIIVSTYGYLKVKRNGKQNLIDLKQRIEMLKFFESELIHIDTKHNNIPYTSDLMNELKKDYNFNLYLIIGADNLLRLNEWHNYEELIKNNIIVVPRDNIDIEYYKNKLGIKNLIVAKDYEPIDISSTEIRDGENKYLDDKVLNYIKDNKLYGR